MSAWHKRGLETAMSWHKSITFAVLTNTRSRELLDKIEIFPKEFFPTQLIKAKKCRMFCTLFLKCPFLTDKILYQTIFLTFNVFESKMVYVFIHI